MTSTTISKLKASLSELLLRVKAGEELIISDRGKIIAKIVPVRDQERNVPAHIHDLEKAGLLRRGDHSLPKNFWELRRPKLKHSAVDVLIADREEGR